MQSSALQVRSSFLSIGSISLDGRHNLAGSVLINKSAGVQWQFRQMHFSSEVGHGGWVGNRMAESGATRAKYAHNKALSTGSVLPGRHTFAMCTVPHFG